MRSIAVHDTLSCLSPSSHMVPFFAVVLGRLSDLIYASTAAVFRRHSGRRLRACAAQVTSRGFHRGCLGSTAAIVHIYFACLCGQTSADLRKLLRGRHFGWLQSFEFLLSYVVRTARGGCGGDTAARSGELQRWLGGAKCDWEARSQFDSVGVGDVAAAARQPWKQLLGALEEI